MFFFKKKLVITGSPLPEELVPINNLLISFRRFNSVIRSIHFEKRVLNYNTFISCNIAFKITLNIL